MSNNEPTPPQNPDQTATYKMFAFVVGNDVAWIHRVDTRVEQAIAVMSSNPTVVVVPDEIAANINYGWSYDGSSFLPPE
jgi:hypothetical protein